MPHQPKTVRAAHFRQMNAHQDDPAYARLDGYDERAAFFAQQVGRQWEIDAAIYDEFLNLLPPMGWRGDTFYLSEFLFDDITHRFSRAGERYFCEIVCYPERPRPEPSAPQRPPELRSER